MYDHKFFLALLILLLPGCGAVIQGTNSSVSCPSDVAMIAVTDAYLQNFCGCNEADGTIATSGTALTCTVSAPKKIVFHYLSQKLKHQIISTGDPTFVSSPLYDPEANRPIRSHGFELTTTGTYTFNDAYNTDLSGQFVVQ